MAPRDQLDPRADDRQHLDDRHLGARGNEPLGRLAAGGAAADDRIALAGRDRDAVVEDLLRVDHVRAGDAGDRRHERIGARRHDHDVGRRLVDRVGVDLDARVDLDAELADDAGLVVAEVEHRRLARRPRGDVELPAELRVALPDRDVVAAEAGDARRFHARGAAADDHHAARRRGGHDLPAVLAADLRVDGAPGLLRVRDEVDARVAGDAGADLVELSLLPLPRQVGICDERTADRDHVAIAVGEDLLRQSRVVEPADRDHGHAHGPLDRRRERHQEAARKEHRADRLSGARTSCPPRR